MKGLLTVGLAGLLFWLPAGAFAQRRGIGGGRGIVGGGFRGGGFAGSHFGRGAVVRPGFGPGFVHRPSFFGPRFGFGFGFGGYSYPVFMGGFDYGYGYGPGYGYGYGYAPPVYAPAPYSIVAYPPPGPVTINQSYAPEPREQPQDRPAFYLIALQDGTIRAAVAYWVDGNKLHYVTRDHEQREVALDAVDRELSRQLNEERRVEFRLPPATR